MLLLMLWMQKEVLFFGHSCATYSLDTGLTASEPDWTGTTVTVALCLRESNVGPGASRFS
ncbi:hypothetical protein [Neobacillus fumarioli]|uniref:hypothetical protein n=1 Tax=Neobacillus fumarioli TaxID=105229 RepID=UPI0008309881|nr:hypothetical protein [Neobacillus fumarioli]